MSKKAIEGLVLSLKSQKTKEEHWRFFFDTLIEAANVENVPYFTYLSHGSRNAVKRFFADVMQACKNV